MSCSALKMGAAGSWLEMDFQCRLLQTMMLISHTISSHARCHARVTLAAALFTMHLQQMDDVCGDGSKTLWCPFSLELLNKLARQLLMGFQMRFQAVAGAPAAAVVAAAALAVAGAPAAAAPAAAADAEAALLEIQ